MTASEIDQKILKEIRNTFVKQSQIRISRMETSLSPVQADNLKLLPLLFHVNHPMLPGYVDKFTPCGLPNYSPTETEKNIAKTVSQSFNYKPRAHLSYKLASLFLMGSMGTLGQSNSSDIDLWVCLAEPLEDKLMGKLEKKGERIKSWLETIGIEMNFYLVNLDDFRSSKNKKIEEDSCGNAQKYLLLDEFYRTAVWIAGRWPLWWVIPVDEDYKIYSKRLIEQKHLDSADWVDFGEVPTIPASEYFSAALWQLYKAISSPYKSLVKLLVLEVYAKLFPCAGVLSNEYKKAIYQSQNTGEEIDPYLMMLQFAEKSLTDQPRRLEFLRRAFYLKTKIKVTGVKKRKPSWRYRITSDLTEKWGWNQARLDYLNNRHQWSVDIVSEERNDLVRELTNSYHFLSNFARVQGVVDKLAKNDLMLLGRKLYAAFERRSGKIDRLNNGITKNLLEIEVTLYQKTNQSWELYLGHLSFDKVRLSRSVVTTPSLFESLAWGCINGLISNATQCHLLPVGDYLNHQFVSEQIRDITHLLKTFYAEKKENFEKEANPILLGAFINTRRDPLAVDKQDNLYRVAESSDCFRWTDNKQNLAGHFDVICLNSWNEITLEHFSGISGWIEFFIKYKKSASSLIDSISIFCRGVVQKDEVVFRLTELLGQWKHLLANTSRTKQTNIYLIAIQKKYLAIRFTPEKIDFKVYQSLPKLYDGLSLVDDSTFDQSKIKFHIDPYLTIEPIVASAMKRRLGKELEFYVYQKTDKLVQVVVKSSTGAIHYQEHKHISLVQVVGHYQQFFDKIQNRSLLNSGLLETVSYFEFIKSANHSLRAKHLEIGPSSVYQQFSLVQAIAVNLDSTKVAFDFFTSDASYLYHDWGANAYIQLSKALLKMRKTGETYPIFLTDIDLSALKQEVSVIEALSYKKQIEHKLARM